jgi:hypothetical protein
MIISMGYRIIIDITSEEFLKRVSKVGPGSEFSYRCKFDPVPSSELKKKRSVKKKK